MMFTTSRLFHHDAICDRHYCSLFNQLQCYVVCVSIVGLRLIRIMQAKYEADDEIELSDCVLCSSDIRLVAFERSQWAWVQFSPIFVYC